MPMQAGNAGMMGVNRFDVMGGALPAGNPRTNPAGRRPNAGAANAVKSAMNFNDFNSYPQDGGRPADGGGGGGGSSFMLDEDIEAEPRYASEDPSWGAVNAKSKPAFASKATIAPAGKGPNTMTILLLLAVLLAGGMVTFREEIFAFGVSVKDIGHVKDLEESEQAQVELAVNGESEIPVGGGGDAASDGGDGGGGEDGGGETETAMTMTEAVEAGSATDATAEGEETAGAVDATDATEPADGAAAVEGATTTTTTTEDEESNNAFAAPDASASTSTSTSALQDEPAGTPEDDNAAGDAPAAACEDTSPHCVAWKKDGQCDSNPRFMALQCANTCDLCEGSEGHAKLHAPAAGAAESVTVERPQKSTLWGMLTGKTAKHLEGGTKLRTNLAKHAPMEKLDHNTARNKAKTKKTATGDGEDNKKDIKNKKKDKDKQPKDKEAGGGKKGKGGKQAQATESGTALAARLYNEQA